MKRFKNFVIGGIQSKVFNLILYTVLLLTAAFMVVSIVQSNMLAKLAGESGQHQQAAITEITSATMDQVVTLSLARTNHTEAATADRLFQTAANRVAFLADYAAKLFAHPEDYGPQPYAGPDPKDDGTWTAKVLYADGVDPDDPAVAGRMGLLANMTELMASLCPNLKAATVYIALPEGVHFSMSDNSSGWFEDGHLKHYDPRQRIWYQKAVEAGGLIFTDGEWDAHTGVYCIECAMPVYGPDGSLTAVVGTDLFLDEMQAVMDDTTIEGEHMLLLNEEGRAVLPAQVSAFPMDAAALEGDLRQSGNAFLAGLVSDALQGSDTGVVLGELADGAYYATATPIPTTGWVLVSVYSQAISSQPTTLLVDSFSRIQEEAALNYQAGTQRSRTMATLLLIVVMLLTLGGALVLGKRIVRPLNTITRRIAELNEGNLEFRMEDVYRTGDEVEELAESFAALSHKTVVYMDKVVKVTAEKERIGAELSLATDIQTAMLPHIFPAFPERTEFDIFASMDPAKEVGGDFYDYFLIDDDHLCMVIADVSGKGVPAALFMMASKIMLQSVAMMGKSPAEILAKTNDAVCTNNEAQMFVTAWLGILEISTGRLVAASAGHEYPAIMHTGGQFELYKDTHGFVIGGLEGMRYREYEVKLEPGSKLFVYTDGVPEATSAQKELFGVDRMVDALNVDPEARPNEVMRNVRRAVDAFVKDAEQFDDLTMLCLEYKGVKGV